MGRLKKHIISCEETRDKFSSFMDAQLCDKEQELFLKHIEVCKNCSVELDSWNHISMSLRQLPGVEAPVDFAQSVIDRIRDNNRADYSHFVKLRKGIAAAAAIAVITFGSLGVNAGLKLAQNKEIIPKRPGQMAQLAANPNSPAHNNNILPKIDSQSPGTTGDDQVRQREQPSNNAVTQQQQKNPPQRINNNVSLPNKGSNDSKGADKASPVMLSRDLILKSQVIKLSVNDVDHSRFSAQQIAASCGGKISIISTQEQAQDKLQILKATVPNKNWDKAVSEYTALGTVIDKKEDSVNITLKYNELLLSYNELLAQNATQNDSNINEQITAVKKQLDDWKRDADNCTLILWLESK